MAHDHAGVQRSMLDYQGNREHQEILQGKVRQHLFRIPVFGTGRVTVQCPFSPVFVEPPFMNFGAHLADNEAALGTEPMLRAIVRSWQTIQRGDSTDPKQRYWLAANVTLLIEGHDNQRIVAHVTFKGVSIGMPTGLSLGDSATTEDTI